jgi:hypothetical protein
MQGLFVKLFSKYWSDQGPDVMYSLPLLMSFIENMVEIDESVEYTHVSAYFDQNPEMLRNNKIVLNTHESMRRLIYITRMLVMQDLQSVQQYHTKTFCDGLFEQVTDFETWPFTLFFASHAQLLDWGRGQTDVLRLLPINTPVELSATTVKLNTSFLIRHPKVENNKLVKLDLLLSDENPKASGMYVVNKQRVSEVGGNKQFVAIKSRTPTLRQWREAVDVGKALYENRNLIAPASFVADASDVVLYYRITVV